MSTLTIGIIIVVAVAAGIGIGFLIGFLWVFGALLKAFLR